MQKAGAAMAELGKVGIEAIHWATNDAEAANRAPYDYMAVWRVPVAAAVKTFEETVEKSGWYGYFEQVNARGENKPLDEVMGHILGLK